MRILKAVRVAPKNIKLAAVIIASAGFFALNAQCAPGPELIVDGSFEGVSCGGNEGYCGYSVAQGNVILPDKGWVIPPVPTTSSIGIIPNHGKKQEGNTGVTQFYNTPEGNISVTLFGVSALTQGIATDLEGGKTYHFSFHQSSFYHDAADNSGWYLQSGKVLVELSKTKDGSCVYSNIFTVAPQTKWTKKEAKITLKPGETGKYTLKFSSFEGFGGNIDAVSLREKL